jgi:hypothetical protein
MRYIRKLYTTLRRSRRLLMPPSKTLTMRLADIASPLKGTVSTMSRTPCDEERPSSSSCSASRADYQLGCACVLIHLLGHFRSAKAGRPLVKEGSLHDPAESLVICPGRRLLTLLAMFTKTLSGSSVGAVCRSSVRDKEGVSFRMRERERTGRANAGQSARLTDAKRRTAIRDNNEVHGLHALTSRQLI